ncbi:hypothetical protein [Acinetobacter pollinis]|uniref:hypothetical protein n=1 Tax=Acinetobacter pollinis TaxID=2605270 RepID=UPI0018A29688|nr:hypothetical protein [Acinetobacter pollinis]MBF7691704.1 hypothetical protein [Acinetobacter pollinis]MBF7699279.1 hypothetical protein [Acinetobacter pollinis]
MSKVYKIRTDEVEDIKDSLMKFVLEKKTMMKETDVLHALIKFHLKNLKSEEVLEWRKKYLGKDE